MEFSLVDQLNATIVVHPAMATAVAVHLNDEIRPDLYDLPVSFLHGVFPLLVVKVFKLAEQCDFAQVGLVWLRVLQLTQNLLSQSQSLVLRNNQTNKIRVMGLAAPHLLAFTDCKLLILATHGAIPLARCYIGRAARSDV
uniref:hypothetical protein n=1 Tax=Pseudomonas aeruginosa TaxID=287 RepID=UPI00155DB131|nr:hypothetical protein [Pseudomonas aeruginosa]